jgi:hypothetical protein
MKLNINGYARHGKDTVADMFCEEANLKKLPASLMYAEDIMTAGILGPYDSIEECFEDRVNHRAEWYDFIRSITDDNPFHYVIKTLTEGDMYVGHRSRYAFEKTQSMCDATIWVDASERGLPQEGRDSCNLDHFGHDFVINNGLSIAHTRRQVQDIIRFLKNKERAINAYS